MQEQQYFDQNPLKPYLQQYADYTKNYHPTEFQAHGKRNFIQISEDNKEKIDNAFLQIQIDCTPTIQKLRNVRNIAQLQEKIYLKVKKYEDSFNNCLAKARTPNDGDYCADELVNNLTVDFKPKLKKILEEY